MSPSSPQAKFSCQVKTIHDANIVATMLAHNVKRLITANTQDCSRFADAIALFTLLDF
ncbi:MAG: hypothetical protein IPJ88_05945 [Myxococcales bacterium]|nr:MAG: hypothetical protein IPJ88_05945 [Myxococcales bacterium]